MRKIITGSAILAEFENCEGRMLQTQQLKMKMTEDGSVVSQDFCMKFVVAFQC